VLQQLLGSEEVSPDDLAEIRRLLEAHDARTAKSPGKKPS